MESPPLSCLTYAHNKQRVFNVKIVQKSQRRQVVSMVGNARLARLACWTGLASSTNWRKPPHAGCGKIVGGHDPRKGRRVVKREQKIRLRDMLSYGLFGAAFLFLAAVSLSSCANAPHWLGGLPADAPPRRGTLEYDAWIAQRAQEAARPKTEQQQPNKYMRGRPPA